MIFSTVGLAVLTCAPADKSSCQDEEGRAEMIWLKPQQGKVDVQTA